jgi:hypothetical protein
MPSRIRQTSSPRPAIAFSVSRSSHAPSHTYVALEGQERLPQPIVLLAGQPRGEQLPQGDPAAPLGLLGKPNDAVFGKAGDERLDVPAVKHVLHSSKQRLRLVPRPRIFSLWKRHETSSAPRIVLRIRGITH